MSANVRVNIENFRAIHKAEIKIDGITLVAGENGCGKSTLSKLLYFLYKTVSNYDYIVKKQLLHRLSNLSLYINILIREIKLSHKERQDIINTIDSNINQEDWLNLINKIECLLKDNDQDISKSVRLSRITKDLLGDYYSDSEKIDFNKIKEKIKSHFKEVEGLISSRPKSLFTRELEKEFSNSKLPSKFEVFEEGDTIVSLNEDNLSIPYTIQNTIYTDTPMSISVENMRTHWDDLNNLLKDGKDNSLYKDMDIVSIIQGNSYFSNDQLFGEEFKYKRLDGKTFDLLDVATGIKAFSILQLLLKGGHLNDKTLLIIDEPESNLHPQWIVEYARIIVNLNKHLGVKFFLASHNPDMVSAIRYISEKEGVLEDVNFYLAEKEKETFTYNYKHLEKEIDPIFESFNIAIDRINKYSV
ncbi:AAA family ATPase [Capnocytophaga canis]|uniref:AAA family ATPase n=1 Tax=Capnocytophaga canis TaxID=1848903 RepID=UPI0037D7BC50